MNFMLRSGYFSVALLLLLLGAVAAQDVKSSNAQAWSLSGRVQLQHLYNSDIKMNDAQTNGGFRMRRVRVQAGAKINPYLTGKIQFEVRDNSPALKDAELKLKLFDNFYFKGGQFKVPVWREELRSSGKLLLVERSPAAEFLAAYYLSARHIGVEFGGQFMNNSRFALNYSNGAGEGIREDAGRTKSMNVNNGKLFTGRVNLAPSEVLEVGFSAAVNQLGYEAGNFDNTSTITAFAPDFGIYLPAGLDVEGGAAFGKFGKDFFGSNEDINYLIFDISGRWTRQFAEEMVQLAGMSAFELAAGFSRIDGNTDVDNNEYSVVRFGPALYFGKHARLQVNGEIEMPAAENTDNVFLVRSQFTLNL
ncbi:MAG: porin [Calditrichia bacterium]